VEGRRDADHRETEVLRKRISALQELSKDPKESGTASLAQYEQMRGLYETPPRQAPESERQAAPGDEGRVEEPRQADETLREVPE